jgi:hypothetical protein
LSPARFYGWAEVQIFLHILASCNNEGTLNFLAALWLFNVMI